MSGFPLQSAWKTPRVWLPGSRLTPCRGAAWGTSAESGASAGASVVFLYLLPY